MAGKRKVVPKEQKAVVQKEKKAVVQKEKKTVVPKEKKDRAKHETECHTQCQQLMTLLEKRYDAERNATNAENEVKKLNKKVSDLDAEVLAYYKKIQVKNVHDNNNNLL
jgi:hypothetical protein